MVRLLCTNRNQMMVPCKASFKRRAQGHSIKSSEMIKINTLGFSLAMSGNDANLYQINVVHMKNFDFFFCYCCFCCFYYNQLLIVHSLWHETSLATYKVKKVFAVLLIFFFFECLK